jgi:hypothetical protein
MQDVSARLANRVQLTTDGHRAYLPAVEEAFGAEVDYARLRACSRPCRKPEARCAQSPPNLRVASPMSPGCRQRVSGAGGKLGYWLN